MQKKQLQPKKSAHKKAAKKKLMALPEKQEVYYMGIANPIEVRRTVLECARDMVQFLQMYERFRVIRLEKIEASKLLKKHVREITVLVNKLKSLLPKTSFREKVSREEIRSEPEVKKEQIKEEKERMPENNVIPDTDIDDIEALESELRLIEEKLNFL